VSVAELSARLAASPYARFLGVRLEAADDDALTLRLPYRDALANRNRTVHGGVTASVLDVAGALLADGSAPRAGRTLDLSLRFLAPAEGEDLVADARLVRRGGAITVVAVDARTDAGVAVATALLTRRAADRPGPSLDRPSPSLAPADALDRPVRSGSPFTGQLGVAVSWFAPGKAIGVLPFRSVLADADGRLHEGALAALSDSVSGGASWSVHGLDPRGRASTLGMHLCFHAEAPGGDVVGESHVVGHDDRVFQNAVTLREQTTGATVATGWLDYRIARADV
jgi:uncharacterized protein (TIGR00369 family)